ncbi:unnamed protein product [Arctia plantaginis]|uniref:Uncharacterized protein n=1 Tax=Arctia plantaginis TaxID=874455 RepID=A0A8S0YNQ1_ARCPL|nr:unnamed protein product [Arctia plantaginis]
MSVACAAHGAGDFVTTSGKLLISGFYGNRKECCRVRLRTRHLLSCLYNITSHVSSGREPVTGRRRCRSRRRRVTGRGGAPPDMVYCHVNGDGCIVQLCPPHDGPTPSRPTSLAILVFSTEMYNSRADYSSGMRCARCASISGVVDRGIGTTGGRFHSVRVESRSGSASPAERRFRVKLGRISGDDVTRGSASSPGAARDMPNRA